MVQNALVSKCMDYFYWNFLPLYSYFFFFNESVLLFITGKKSVKPVTHNYFGFRLNHLVLIWLLFLLWWLLSNWFLWEFLWQRQIFWIYLFSCRKSQHQCIGKGDSAFADRSIWQCRSEIGRRRESRRLCRKRCKEAAKWFAASELLRKE